MKFEAGWHIMIWTVKNRLATLKTWRQKESIRLILHIMVMMFAILPAGNKRDHPSERAAEIRLPLFPAQRSLSPAAPWGLWLDCQQPSVEIWSAHPQWNAFFWRSGWIPRKLIHSGQLLPRQNTASAARRVNVWPGKSSDTLNALK